MSFRQWLEHKTNAEHILCRVLDCLLVYDRLWKRVFNRKRCILSKRELVTLIHLWHKKKALEKERNELREHQK